MPVTGSLLIYQALKDGGVQITSALPETWLVHLRRMAEDDPALPLSPKVGSPRAVAMPY